MILKTLKNAVKMAELVSANEEGGMRLDISENILLTKATGPLNICVFTPEEPSVEDEDLFSEEIVSSTEPPLTVGTKLGYLSEGLKSLKSATKEVTFTMEDKINASLACNGAVVTIPAELANPIRLGDRILLCDDDSLLRKFFLATSVVNRNDKLIEDSSSVKVSFTEEAVSLEAIGIVSESLLRFPACPILSGVYELDRSSLKNIGKLLKSLEGSIRLEARQISSEAILFYLVGDNAFISVNAFLSEKDLLFPDLLSGSPDTVLDQGDGISIDWDYYNVPAGEKDVLLVESLLEDVSAVEIRDKQSFIEIRLDDEQFDDDVVDSFYEDVGTGTVLRFLVPCTKN